mmetsp:Transcript_39017/g.59394  ORF Transcript_39017/g.59394 Transcript_39017/m.59394 type:complete len:95 (-) Transcript_39017:4460-4744(-)
MRRSRSGNISKASNQSLSKQNPQGANGLAEYSNVQVISKNPTKFSSKKNRKSVGQILAQGLKQEKQPTTQALSSLSDNGNLFVGDEDNASKNYP